MIFLIIAVVIICIAFFANSEKKSTEVKQTSSVGYDSEKENKDNLFEYYLEANKDLTYNEIEQKIESGRKSNYEDYTIESKMEFRALKTLQEKIKTENFRKFFIEKRYLSNNVDFKELNCMLNSIDFNVRQYKMVPIPEEIITDAKNQLHKKELNNISSQSIVQLKIWIEKRKETTLPSIILEYYQYRLDYEEEEYRLNREATRLRSNINANANKGNVDKAKEYKNSLEEILQGLEHIKKSFLNR